MRETLPQDAPPRPPTAGHDADLAVEQTRSLATSQPHDQTYVLFGVQRLWRAAAVVCLLLAAVLGWRGRLDATFVVATLGVVAWFLDQRNLLRARSIEAATDEEESTEFAEEDEQQ